MRPWQSLRRKLPLLVSGLLVVVVGLVCGLSYVEVEKTLIRATGIRAASISERMAEALHGSGHRMRHDVGRLAAESSLVRFLSQPAPGERALALATLERQREGNTQSIAVALWDAEGRRLLVSGPQGRVFDHAPGAPESLQGAGPAAYGAWVGALTSVDSAIVFQVAAPVLGAARDTLGWVVEYRPLATRSSAAQVAALVGADATMIVGNATGTMWTDFLRPVQGPRASAVHDGSAHDVTIAGERVHGASAAIGSTPWRLWVQIRHAQAIAPARRFVVAIAGIGLLLVGLGTLAAWAACNRITAPLAEVSRAAQDIARGEYARRVSVVRGDELGVLSASFNSMAAQVETASHDLRRHAAELEAANMSLRAGEARFRGLVEAAHEGICAVDEQGTITYGNARLAQMLGCAVDELPGRSLFSFMDHESGQHMQQRFVRRAQRSAHTVEAALRRVDGSQVWASVSVSSLFDGEGTCTGALFLLSDIAERRAADERVRSSERHFRALIENASDMICVIEADGRLRYVSPAQERHLGYTSSDLEGRIAIDYVHPDDAPRTLEAFAQARRSVGAPVSARYRHRHKDGSWRELSTVATNLLDDPAVRGIVVNSHDITEEAALAVQLVQAQKMEAVGQLAGGIAHDFNNLLTVMSSYCGMLLEEVSEEDPMHGDLEEIRRAAERAAELTRQLLAFSRQQVLQPQIVDLNVVVVQIEKMLRRLLRADVRLETSLAQGLGKVHADPGQLEQVIVNLAVNARDAMPDGGELTIETSEVELTDDYARLNPGVAPGAYVMLAVRDTGIGMNAEILARVFEPFFTTKGVGEGTGLGLPTAYGIIKQSGGHVSVHSEPGVGTTFQVYLPRQSCAPESGAIAAPHPVVHGGTETVLLVEDEAPVRVAARRILERAGYTVLEASSASDALRLCDEHRGPIDLLLTDIVMPSMGGSELAALFRTLRPGAGTAFMSGYSEDAVLGRIVFEPGAVFVGKPFTPEGLTRKVREALMHNAREALVGAGS